MGKKRRSRAEIHQLKELQKHPFLDQRVLDFLNAPAERLQQDHHKFARALDFWQKGKITRERISSPPWMQWVRDYDAEYDPQAQKEKYTAAALRELQRQLRETLDAARAGSYLGYLAEALRRLIATPKVPGALVNPLMKMQDGRLILDARAFQPTGFDGAVWVMLLDLLQHEKWADVLLTCAHCGGFFVTKRHRSALMPYGGVFCSSSCRAKFYMKKRREDRKRPKRG